MGLFREYNTIPPTDFPSHWLSESIKESEKKFRLFCNEKLEMPELKRMEKFLEKKTVQEFMDPVIGKGYYKIVTSMTDEEINQLPNLSNKQHKTKLFGLIKNNEVKISVKGKEIIPHKLKVFAPMILLKEIQNLEPSKNIKPDDKVIKICNRCDRGKINRGQYEWESTFVPARAGYTERDYNGNTTRRVSSVSAHYVDVQVSLEKKCPVCKKKWKTGFSFQNFLKYVKKFNEKIVKINKKIVKVNEKAYILEEYNDMIEKLNVKILTWNTKCPYNAIDKKHESDDDYFRYWGKSNNSTPANDSNISNNTYSRGSLPKDYVNNDEIVGVSKGGAMPKGYSNNDEVVEVFKTDSIPKEDALQVSKPSQSEKDPLKVLKIRFAKGEITVEEFKEMKEVLKQ